MTEVIDPAREDCYRRVIEVLDRRGDIPALEALISAVKGGEQRADLRVSAIVLDTNVFLRIPSHKKSSDIMDYLTGVHDKPVLVPGQAIQEFWNNQFNAINTVHKAISKKHDEISKEIDRYQDSGVIGIEVVSEALGKFKAGNEHVFEPELVNKTSTFLERLLSKAIVPFAPRSGLADIAVSRKRAKTPPGFKDDGDGDFLVWVDLLWGLLKEKKAGATFEHVILLSQDAKIDWSREKIAHPVLTAELSAVLGAQFEIWTLDQFAKAVEGVVVSVE